MSRKISAYKMCSFISILCIIAGFLLIDNFKNIGCLLVIVGLMSLIFGNLLICIIKNRKQIDDFTDKQSDKLFSIKEEQTDKLLCSRCGSDDINVQIINDYKKSSGCLLFLFQIILFFVNLLLWIISLFIPKKEKKTTAKYAICQNCGNSWRLS